MSDKIKIQEAIMSTPYNDNEHSNIRFDIKENEDVTKHLLFYKTDKKIVFPKGENHLIFYLRCLKKFKHFQKYKTKMMKMTLKHSINSLIL